MRLSQFIKFEIPGFSDNSFLLSINLEKSRYLFLASPSAQLLCRGKKKALENQILYYETFSGDSNSGHSEENSYFFRNMLTNRKNSAVLIALA